MISRGRPVCSIANLASGPCLLSATPPINMAEAQRQSCCDGLLEQQQGWSEFNALMHELTQLLE